MTTVNIHEAKSNFLKLVDAAMAGETIIIAKAGKPVAMLTPIDKMPKQRKFGALKGKMTIPKDFDSSLPNDILSDFNE